MKTKVLVYNPFTSDEIVKKALHANVNELHLYDSKEDIVFQLKNYTYDVIVMYDTDPTSHDVMFDLVKRYQDAPIMVISKLTHVQQVTHTLSLGADDYVAIQEDSKLIQAKLDALVRRSRYIKRLRFGKIKFQHLIINLNTFEVYGQGQLLPITYKEFELLRLFFSNPNHTIKKEDLFQQLWNVNDFYSENVINVHMRHIRKKIELDPKKPKVLLTVWGFGYKLGEGNVEFID